VTRSTRDFNRYFTGETVSTFGSAVSGTAVTVLAVRTFNVPIDSLSVLIVCGMVPALVCGLLGGSIGDRIQRPRRVLIWFDLLAAAALAIVALALWRGWATLLWLCLLNATLTGLSATANILYFVHLKGLTGSDGPELARARGRLQAGDHFARVTGRGLSGALLAAVGSAGALCLDALTYLLSVTALSRIQAPDQGVRRSSDEPSPHRRRIWHTLVCDVGIGTGVILSRPFLRQLSASLLISTCAAGATSTLIAPFLLRTLAVPTPLYGLLTASAGVAGLVGSLVAVRVADRSHRKLVLGGYAGAALSASVVPLAGGPLLVTGTVAALGLMLPVLFGAIANIGLTSLVTADVPEAVLGRAVATLQTATGVTTLLGCLGGGVLGSSLGTRPALWIAASLSAVAASLLVRMPVSSGTAAAGTHQPRTDTVELAA